MARERTIVMYTTQTVNTASVINESDWKCGDPLIFQFNPIYCIIFGCCVLFGLIYMVVGYRLLRSSFFLTGFIFMSLLIYLICIQVPNLPTIVIILAPIVCGLLFGLICSLLFFIGFFVTGYFFGFGIALYSLIIVNQFFVLPTFWIAIGLLFGAGLFTAFISIKFTRVLSIISTSILGSCLLIVGLDYFVTMFLAVRYVYGVIRRVDDKPALCWITIVMLAAPILLTILSMLVQFLWTAKGIVHKERYVPCLTAMKQVFFCVSGAKSTSPKKYPVSSSLTLSRASHSDLDLVSERPLLRGSVLNNNNTGSRHSTYLRGGTLTGTTSSSASGNRTVSRGSYLPAEHAYAANPACTEADKFCQLYRIRQMRGDVPSDSAKKSFQLRYSSHFDGESEA